MTFAGIQRSTLFRLLILTIVIIAAVRMLDFSSQPPAPVVKHPENSDYYLRGVTLVSTNINGEQDYKMQAETVLHYPDGRADLINVNADRLGGRKGIWRMTAANGKMPRSGNAIELGGGVRLYGLDSNAGTEITTETMTVYTDKNEMKTEAPVTLTRSKQVTEAVGMQARFDSRDMELLNDVYTIFQD